MAADFNTYLSPFTWRYGEERMRRLWSQQFKRQLWRQIWAALAQAQSEWGLVSAAQVEDLQAHVSEVDIPRSLEIEARIHHDLMAEVHAFAEQCPLGGGVIHLGATSMDIEDNADALRIRQALAYTLEDLSALLALFADKIETWADVPVMAFTHLQPAEPTTLGYRLAGYAQDLLADWQACRRVYLGIRGKGFKGAVGTGASYAELIGAENLPAFEARLSQLLELPFFSITTQTYPRKQDYRVLTALAGLGASIYKLAFDWRVLQSPPVGEWREPFAEKQVGSSAMPFKRNPINAEKINSLARALAQMPRLAWDNAAHSLLERTLDDSANRRTMLPEAFLMVSELLRVSRYLLVGMQVDVSAMARNFQKYSPFAATERVLMALSKAGADRQAMHERLRRHALAAWQQVQADQSNRLADLVVEDSALTAYLPAEQLRALMSADGYLGDAPHRARVLAAGIRAVLAEQGDRNDRTK